MKFKPPNIWKVTKVSKELSGDRFCKICDEKLEGKTYLPSTKGGYICIDCITGWGFKADENWVEEDDETMKRIKELQGLYYCANCGEDVERDRMGNCPYCGMYLENE